MFNKVLTWVRSGIGKMINRSNISKQLGIDVAISNKMANAIDLWNKMYTNKAPWLNEKDVKSLNLPSAIASEIARMVTIEMKTEITGSKRADYLNEQYNAIESELRKNVEYGCAEGGLVFKPYIKENKICIDFIPASRFYPTEYDSRGKCTAGIFVAQKILNDHYFTRLEHHKLEGTDYWIINKAFKSKNKDILGEEIPLNTIEEWAEIQSETMIQNVEKPLFGYFKVAMANTIDIQSPLGVSVYSRAVELIEEADKQYSRILWEYQGSELAIDADITALQTTKSGEKLGLPKLKDRLFRATGQSKDNSFYNVFSPEIRDVSLFNGLNRLMQRIEFNCGLAYGTISDPQMIEKTATEIKIAKQRSYSTITDNQKTLEVAIDDLMYAMDIYTTLYNLAPRGNYEVSHEWDDSLIVDAETEQRIRQQEITQGLRSRLSYIIWRYGFTEEQAMYELGLIDKEKQQMAKATSLFNEE